MRTGAGIRRIVTVEAQKLRWLQGQLLYGVAALQAMRRHWCYLDLSGTIDREPLDARPTLMISVMLGHREGGFVLADARLDDGWFDCLHATSVSPWEALG